MAIKIEEPEYELPLPEHLKAYKGEKFIPDLPETKRERFMGYKQGRIPFYALSPWEQKQFQAEGFTGLTTYGQYMSIVREQNLQVKMANWSKLFGKHRDYILGLSPEETDAYLERSERKRLQRMVAFEEKWGVDFADILDYSRGEGRKWEQIQAWAKWMTPAQREAQEASMQEKVDAAEVILWQNASVSAITRLDESQFAEFKSLKYQWFWAREQEIPWELNTQELLEPLESPVYQLPLADLIEMGLIDVGDELTSEEAIFYGLDVPEGSILRIDPVAEFILTIVSEEGEETSVDVGDIRIRDWSKPNTLNYDQMINVGFKAEDLEGMEDWDFSVLLNEEGNLAVTTYLSPAGWEFNQDGSATDPEDKYYDPEEVDELEVKERRYLEIVDNLYPALYEIAKSRDAPWLGISVSYDEMEQPYIPQFEDTKGFMEYMGEHPDVLLSLLQKRGETDDTKEFLMAYFEDFFPSEKEVNEFYYEPAMWEKALAYVGLGAESVGKFMGYNIAFISAGICDIFHLPMSQDAKDFIVAYDEASTPQNPFGFLFSDEVHGIYDRMLPTAWRVPVEVMPWLMLPSGIGLRAGLQTPAMVGGITGATTRLIRFGLWPIAGVERGMVYGLKWGIGLPFRAGRFAVYLGRATTGAVPFTAGQTIRMMSEVALDRGITAFLARRGLGGIRARRVMNEFISKHGAEVKPIAEKNILSAKAAGESMQESSLTMARKTVEEITPALESAIKATEAAPPAMTETALRKVATERGYSITKLAASTKMAKEGYVYKIEGLGDKVYARNLQEATNFVEAGSITGFVGRTKVNALVNLIFKVGELTPEERALMNRLTIEVDTRESSQAIARHLRIKDAHIPSGMVKDSSVIKNTAEASREVNREFYDAVVGSPLDEAVTGWKVASMAGKSPEEAFAAYRSGLRDLYELKVEALTKQVGMNMEEIQNLRQLALKEIDSVKSWSPTKIGEMTELAQAQIGRLERDIKFIDDLITKVESGAPLTIDDAVSLGIALRTTKVGNLRAAVRDSGFYVTDDFVKGDFWDVPAGIALTSTPRDMFKAMDLGFFAKRAQQYIFWPAQRADLAMRDFAGIYTARVSEIFGKYNMTGFGSRGLRKRLFDLAELIGKDDIVRPVDKILARSNVKDALTGLSIAEQRNMVGCAKDLRVFLDEMIGMANSIRDVMGRDRIGYIEKYMTHVRDTSFWSKVGGVFRTSEDVMKASLLPDYITPNQPFFRSALQRMGLAKKYELEKDVLRLMTGYVNGISKDIFYTPIIHNAKIHAAVFRSMGYPKNAVHIEKWAAEIYAGTLPRLERFVREVVEGIPAGEIGLRAIYGIRARLNMAVFPANWVWTGTIQTSSMALTIKHTGLVNTLRGLEYLTNGAVRSEVRANAYSWITKAQEGGSMIFQDIGEKVAGGYRAEAGVLDKASHYLNFLLRTMEEKLTGVSVRAGYYRGQQLGFKDRALWEWASDVGAKTQSMYNKADIPAVMRSRIVGTFVPFQTFAFEMFNAVRELNVIGIRQIIGRVGAYETVAAHSALGKAMIDMRVKMILEWVAAMWLVNETVEKLTGRKPYVASSFIPGFSILMSGTELSNPWNHPLPMKWVNDFWDGINDVIKYDNWDDLRQWFFRYNVPAGLQVSKMWDGIQAVIHGEVLSAKGQALFEIDTDDWTEVIKAVTAGPYATEAGQAYIDEMRKSKGPLYDFLRISLPERFDINTELINGEGLLGATDEEGNIYTIDNFRNLVTSVRNKVGEGRLDEFSPLANVFINGKHLYDEVYEIAGMTPGETTRLRDEYLLANPDADAFLFFWGYRSTMQTPQALAIVEDLMSTYNIPGEARPELESIDAERLRHNWYWRDEISEYEQISELPREQRDDARSSFWDTHEDFHKAWYRDRALGEDVPDNLIDNYTDYYMIKEVSGYEKEWFMMENNEWYRYWVEVLDHDELTFWRYPTREEYPMFKAYTDAPNDVHLTLRCMSQELDTLLLRLGTVDTPCYGTDRCVGLIAKEGEPPTQAELKARAVEFFEGLK